MNTVLVDFGNAGEKTPMVIPPHYRMPLSQQKARQAPVAAPRAPARKPRSG